MRLLHKKFRAAVVFAAICGTFYAGRTVQAQQLYEGNQQGLPPFGSFHGSNFDNVSLNNGNLHIEIPSLSVGQRGRSFSYRFIYNTVAWTTYWTPNPDPDGFPKGWWTVEPLELGSGWRMAGPTGYGVSSTIVHKSCAGIPGTYIVRTNWVVIEPDGTQHPVPVQLPSVTQGCTPTQLTGTASDGSGIFLDITNWPNETKAYLKDGTRILPSLRDSNGNTASMNSDMLGRDLLATGPNGPTIQYTSPLGATANYYEYTSWVVKDSDGNDQIYRLYYELVDFMPTGACGGPFIPPSQPCYHFGPYAQIRPNKLTLPNGKFYRFYWANNGMGELTRIDLPTGGSIEYTYYTMYFRPPGSTATSSSTSRRAVSSRTVTPGGTWTYGFPFGSNNKATIVDPNGNHEVHTMDFFASGPASSASRYETEVKSYAGSASTGTLLRTISKAYAFETDPMTLRPEMNVRVIRETTTLDNGLGNKVETDFETFQQPFGSSSITVTRLNPTETRQYDFGTGAPGPLARKTTYIYLHTGNPNYLARNIVNRTVTTSVYDGGGALKAQTTNEYDNYTQGIQGTSAVQHDAAFGSSFIYRGNVTAVKRWRNNPAAWLETRRQYDDVGNVISSRDPLNHTTTFDYADAWHNTACAPAGEGRAYLKSSTNALSHTVSHTYYSCTGFVRSATDPNNQTATFTYDSMNRPDVTNLPGGGQVDLDYDDTALWVRSKTLRAPGAYIVKHARYDQLGRVWRNELCEDGAEACATSIKTDTTFDSLGREWKVTNPHRTTGDATYGITEKVFDALGRVTKVIPPDGTAGSNHVSSVYSGNSTTVTDQAGKQRQSFSDALGRLIAVHEPTGGSPATPSAGSATVNAATGGGVQVHNISAVQAAGSVTIGSANPSGAVQSVQEQTGPATQSTGSTTISGSLRSQQVQTQPGAAGTGSVAISGFTRSVTDLDNCTGPRRSDCPVIYDSGGVSITVSGFTATSPYGQGWTAASVANTLANIFNSNSGSPVTATVSNTTVYLTAKTSGAATNYSLSATSWSYDPATFPILSYTATPSGATLTGGQNAQYTTVYDSGTVSVAVNQGQPNAVTVTANYGQGSTPGSVAASLRSGLHATSFVNAGGTGATITLTSEASGSGTNYPLAASWTYNSSQFSLPSFTASASGMSGGADAQYTTVYDSGAVTITVNGVPKSVSYGQGSTTTTVAAALASAIAGDTAYPATASASGATVNLTARTAGTVGNSYTLSASTTYNTSKFSQASFPPSTSGGTLTGGVNGQTIYDSGTVTLTVTGCTPFTVNYQNGSTAGTVATGLRDAVNNNGPCPVSAAITGSQINLTSDGTGSGTNHALSSSATTSYPQYFTQPSFSASTSGMSGGTDAVPASLATPAVTQYTYDALDNLTCVVQKGTDTAAFTSCAAAPAAWRPRSFTYNSLSQLTQASNPETGTVSNAYDNDGNLITKTDARSITTTQSHDELHRLKKKTYSDSTPLVRYAYDGVAFEACNTALSTVNAIGRRTARCDGAGSESWTYDPMGRVLSTRRTTSGVTKDFIYAYNEGGSFKTLTYPSGRVIHYGYDAAGRSLSAVDQANATNYALSAAYAPHGSLSSVVLAQASGFSGITASFTYNNRLQPGTILASSPNGTVLDFAYAYNHGVSNNGNVLAVTNNRNPGRSQSFTYDELNRIKTAQSQATSGGDCWGLDHGYDIWGNLLSATVTKCSVPMLSVGVNTLNRIDASHGYQYDAAGNLTYDPPNFATYVYDAESHTASVSGTLGSATYLYDGDGRRVRKSTGKLYWYGISRDPMAETDLSGNITNEFVFFRSQRIARRTSAGAVYYFLSDHLNSGRVVTNAAGGIVEESDFYPFGGERVIVDSLDNQYKFTGKERDTESGLDNFDVRYYSSSLGRFISPDLIVGTIARPQSLNRYTYGWNNPLRFNDPSGLAPQEPQNQPQGTESGCKLATNSQGCEQATSVPTRDGPGSAATSQQSSAQQQQNAQAKTTLTDRLIMAGTGLANVAIGAAKYVAVAKTAPATLTTPGGQAVAFLGVTSGTGNLGAGLAQLVGSVASDPKPFDETANAIAVGMSPTGLATLAATGDMEKAGKFAAVEGLVTSGVTRSIFSGIVEFVETALGAKDLIDTKTSDKDKP